VYYKRRGETITAGSRKSDAGSVFDRCRGFFSERRNREKGGRETIPEEMKPRKWLPRCAGSELRFARVRGDREPSEDDQSEDKDLRDPR